ncbi:MAG: sulfotransferase domain-containing protein [Cyanosarcina radialis HA8281-LM2]|jgi:hypothetical protein|nr:sulfotransferase domain-containing protein [Cyanosarcina radialis HA8281-LM2]
MSQEIVLIHIGYHKTASTFLQELIFNNSAYGFDILGSRPDYFEKIILVNPFTFEPTSVRQFFQAGILKAWRNSLIPTISEEALSGNIYQGEYNNKNIAERLAIMFPEGRILIVIRRQLDTIVSIYKHRVRSNLTVSIQDYLKQYEARSGFNPLFRFEYLEYHWLIEYYQKLFGQEKVLVLPYESLKVNKSDFLSKISSFTGTKIPPDVGEDIVNPGYSGLTVGLKRWLNMLAPRTAHPNASWYQKLNNSLCYKINNVVPKRLSKAADRQLESYIKEIVGGHYQYSNQMTAKLTGLNLAAYGYEI